jgi:hypothetical protein
MPIDTMSSMVAHWCYTELWTEDGTYTNPLVAVAGHQAIEAVIGGAREMFPGHPFTS